MKICPQCKNDFNDDLNFCLEDGTPLIYESDAEKTVVFNSLSNEIPTQIIPPAQITRQVSTNTSTKWLFLIIGVLATTLLAIAFFVFFFRENKENTIASANIKGVETPEKSAKKNSEAAEKDISDETNIIKSEKATNSASFPVSTPFSNPVVNENLSPNGNWSGDWNSKSAYYMATVTLEETNGRINGRIVWTLKRTSNSQKINKIGASAVEYVQGTYNSQTRMLNLRGIRKDDPNNIVILDRYNLSLSDDNQTLMGKSLNGNFILKDKICRMKTAQFRIAV